MRYSQALYFFSSLLVAFTISWSATLSPRHASAVLFSQTPIPTSDFVLASQAEQLFNDGYRLHRKGDFQNALSNYEQALSIFRRIGDLSGEGKTLSNIAFVYSNAGHYDQALEHYHLALLTLRKAADQYNQGVVLNNIGAVYLTLGQFDEALDSLEEALTIRLEIHDRLGEGVTLGLFGYVYYNLGQYGEALDYYFQSLSIRREVYDQEGEASTLNKIGLTYWRTGQHERALTNYQQSLELYMTLGYPLEQGVAYNNIGEIYYDLKRYDQALANYQQALAIARRLGVPTIEGTVLNNIGETYREAKQYDVALRYLQQASSILKKSNVRIMEATALNSIGETYSLLGRYSQAQSFYQQALTIRKQVGDRAGEAKTLDNIASAYAESGDQVQAILVYKQAIQLLESIRGDINIDQLKTSFAGRHMLTYSRLIELLQNTGNPHEAFDYNERARARTILDLIGNTKLNVQQDEISVLAQQEKALAQLIFGLQNALKNEQFKPLSQQDSGALNTISDELGRARTEHEELVMQLQIASPEYATLVSVNALSLSEVQNQAIDAQTTLLEYFVMDEHMLAWVIDQDHFDVVDLGITRAELTGQVEFFRNLITDRDFDADTAADLYNTLFVPLKPHIRHSNLVVVPHGVLHYLPFAALWDPETSRYLIEDYTLTYAPSASVLKFILDKRNSNEGRLLALGNPDDSLPQAEAEVKAVAQRYGTRPLLRRQATESQFRSAASQADIIHLAAHAEYNPYNPLYTRIELAPDRQNDGNLEVHEIFGLELTGANLVVLSACETALGEQSSGDELVGLTRAFLYAGAPAVVTTLWSIEDEASAALMASFYGHLRAGMTNAEALRAAQIEVLEQGRWQLAYYWAAFTLTGDWRGSEQ